MGNEIMNQIYQLGNNVVFTFTTKSIDEDYDSWQITDINLSDDRINIFYDGKRLGLKVDMIANYTNTEDGLVVNMKNGDHIAFSAI